MARLIDSGQSGLQVVELTRKECALLISQLTQMLMVVSSAPPELTIWGGGQADRRYLFQLEGRKERELGVKEPEEPGMRESGAPVLRLSPFER